MVMEHLLCAGTLHLGGGGGAGRGCAQEDLARLREGRTFLRLLSRELSWGLRQGHEGEGLFGASKGARSLQGAGSLRAF